MLEVRHQARVDLNNSINAFDDSKSLSYRLSEVLICQSEFLIFHSICFEHVGKSCTFAKISVGRVAWTVKCTGDVKPESQIS